MEHVLMLLPSDIPSYDLWGLNITKPEKSLSRKYCERNLAQFMVNVNTHWQTSWSWILQEPWGIAMGTKRVHFIHDKHSILTEIELVGSLLSFLQSFCHTFLSLPQENYLCSTDCIAWNSASLHDKCSSPAMYYTITGYLHTTSTTIHN